MDQAHHSFIHDYPLGCDLAKSMCFLLILYLTCVQEGAGKSGNEKKLQNLQPKRRYLHPSVREGECLLECC